MPLWIQIVYALFLGVLIPVYWKKYGPGNFLWFSDVALFLVGITLYSGLPLPTSMAALAVLVLEVVWNFDFAWQLVTRRRLFGLADYMFDARRSRFLRGLSLFHVPLPVLLLWLLHRLGYDPAALPAMTVLAWIVMPVTYLLTDPARNVNFVHGPGSKPQRRMRPLAYVALLMALIPVCVYLPTHFLLLHLFRAP